MSMQMEVATQVAVRWSQDLQVIPAEWLTRDAIVAARGSGRGWIVVSRNGGDHLYVYTLDEFLALVDQPGALLWSVEGTLGLQELKESTKSSNQDSPPPIDVSWRSDTVSPTIHRWVEVDSTGSILSVGIPDQTSGSAPPPESAAPQAPSAWPESAPAARPIRSSGPVAPGQRSMPPAAPAVAKSAASHAEADEGTNPIRYPSIEADATPRAGKPIRVRVDLLREKSAATTGGALNIRDLPSDWQDVKLNVFVSSPGIEFENDGQGELTIVRNASSIAAEFSGTVRADLKKGDSLEISATFMKGARFCGSALRAFVIGILSPGPDPDALRNNEGRVGLEVGADQPDLTVMIERLDKAKPNLLRWRVIPREQFDGLPANLRADIDLGEAPAETAFKLFSKFSTLVPGTHRASIEGFGDELWSLAPGMFHDAYWALVDHYGRRLTIQFVSDDPHMPWELMRPSTDDESRVHKPLALQQTVARWLDQYFGYMPNRLPGGSLVNIEPKYKTARLTVVQPDADYTAVLQDLGAQTVTGTRAAFLALLYESNPSPPVGVLFFTGHGVYDTKVASGSHIKLEDGGTLTAGEVKSKDVQLGYACRTLVFFNACETASTGAVFGEVGGWADSFLARKFGAFIAPLWAVSETDARKVAAKLLDLICKRREPIGEALRKIREEYADVSPSFYSYLYYGDVTARLGG